MPSVGPMLSGFKQVSPPGFVTIVSTINNTNVLQKPATSGSGGSAVVAAPSVYPWTVGGATANFSSLLTAGRVLRDMGSVQISSTRVFRKFKAVGANAGNALGDAPSASNDWGTFYLETAGDGGDVPAANASVLARM